MVIGFSSAQLARELMEVRRTDLMTHDQDVALPLELHDDGLEPDHHVSVRLPAAVAVIELVVVPGSIVLGVVFLFSTKVRHTPTRDRLQRRTSMSSYVIPSQTPASSSSKLFHVSWGYLSPLAVWIVLFNVEVHTCASDQPNEKAYFETVTCFFRTHRERRVPNRFADELWQGFGVLLSALGKVRVPSDLALDVVLRLAVLCRSGSGRSSAEEPDGA